MKNDDTLTLRGCEPPWRVQFALLAALIFLSGSLGPFFLVMAGGLLVRALCHRMAWRTDQKTAHALGIRLSSEQLSTVPMPKATDMIRQEIEAGRHPRDAAAICYERFQRARRSSTVSLAYELLGTFALVVAALGAVAALALLPG